MKDGINSRVSRLVTGSIHSFLDSVEKAVPEAVMEQAIREVDDAISDVRSELSQIISERHIALTRLADENRRHEELEEKIEHALSRDREDLAEAAVARQLDIEAQLPIIEQRIQECSSKQDELEGFISALQARQREMEDELHSIRSHKREAENLAAGNSFTQVSEDAQAKADRAASAFDKAKQNIPGSDLDPKSPATEEKKKLVELDNLARGNRIKERLAQIKAGRTGSDVE